MWFYVTSEKISVFQDEAQGYHWNNAQATINTFVAYLGTDTQGIDHVFCVVISNCLCHDSISMSLFQ